MAKQTNENTKKFQILPCRRLDSNPAAKLTGPEPRTCNREYPIPFGSSYAGLGVSGDVQRF